MNAVSKVVLPSTFLLDYYFYHSYITLGITWLITPLLLYVIISKSKDLKGYKWFILNHSLWCLFLETLICMFKPLILTPAIAGYPLSLIKEDGSFFQSGVALIIIAASAVSFAIGLGATIGSRYLLIFPSKIMKVLNLKIVTILAGGATIIFYCGIVILAITNFSSGNDEILQQAIQYDSFFKTFNETSLVLLPYKSYQTLVFCIFGLILLLIVAAITVICIFIHLVQTSATITTTTKMQKSLIISSIIQILLTCCFLIFPVLAIVYFIAFQIPNSASWSTVCLCIVSSYGVIDFMATLYFVAPYRRFVKKLIFKFFVNQSSNIQVITIVPSRMMKSVQVHVIVNVVAR